MTASKSVARYDSEKHCGGTKRNGGLCERPKGWGTQHQGVGHCKLHLGATATHEASGQLEKARQACELLAIPVAINPLHALQDRVAEAEGYVEYFRRQVQALDPDMVWVRPTSILRRPMDIGKEGEDPGFVVEEITEAPLDLNIAIRAHQQAMEDSRRYAKTAAAAGVDERLLKVDESVALLFSQAMRGLLEDLQIPVDAKVLGYVQKRLQAIDSTAEDL